MAVEEKTATAGKGKKMTEKEHPWELKPVYDNAEHMFAFVRERARALKLVKTLAVMDRLRPAHEKQPRWSNYGFGTTYLVHPLTMACQALAMGLEDDDVIAACLAHDMVEDAGVKPEELPEGRAREAVKLVSKNLCDRSRPDWEDRYYGEIRKDPLACLVKCLDRVNNLAGMADGFDRAGMIRYTAETDRYYPDLLAALREAPEYSSAAWLLKYQLTALLETFKRLL